MLPNHFLRMMVYHVSLGAQYLDNFVVDQDYMSLLWELLEQPLMRSSAIALPMHRSTGSCPT